MLSFEILCAQEGQLDAARADEENLRSFGKIF
jgi:hypothetical protein